MSGKCFFQIVGIVMAFVCASCDNNAAIKNPRDLCGIYRQKPSWRSALQRASTRYHVPASTIMAIMYTESRFVATARTPQRHIMGVPLMHASTALGYAQVLDGTWRYYLKSTNQLSADRENFADASLFIAWYVQSIQKACHLKSHQVAAIYLAYHNGIAAYQRGQVWHDAALVRLSKSVERLAKHYAGQLCPGD